MDNIKLTKFSRSAGCGCKIAPTQLQEILLSNVVPKTFEQLLVGYNNSDDAAVFEIENGNCIISTTDFFMPIVDDAFEFGKIAAANSLSDIYAMGAKPLMALGVLGFPIDKLPTSVAQQILEGARDICQKANIPLAGGHSIDSLEPFFGLAVTGMVSKQHLKTNAGAQVGDVLFITKPIGSGILATAHKREIASETEYKTLIETTCKLNNIGELFGTLPYVNALTDITGFGLLGHLTEIAKASKVCAQINYPTIPLLNGVESLLKQFIYPDNTTRNLNAYKNSTKGMDGLEFLTLCDPQTNGGLLVSVSANRVDDFHKIIDNNKFYECTIYEIGSMKPMQSDTLVELV